MKSLSISLIFSIVINHTLFSQKHIVEIIEDEATDIVIDNQNNPVHKVAIFDTILWASDYGNGEVFKSIDNGRTFNQIATLGSEYIESIQFLDENTGFICGDYGFVYKTKNGGETWIEISPKVENRIVNRYRNDSTKNQQPDGQFVAYYSMHFISETSGYVSGFKYNPKIGFRNSHKNVYYYTSDGGSSWRLVDSFEQKEITDQARRELTIPNRYIENEYFSQRNISWRTKRDKNKIDLLIKKNYQTNTADTITLSKTSYQKVMLRSIVFLSDKIGFVFGGALDEGNEKAIVYATKDGGKNWSFMKSNMDHVHVAAANNEHLFIFGKNGLMMRIPINKIAIQ